MKKIEEEFVKEFNESLDNHKTFEDIKDKINITRFKKDKASSNKTLYRILGVAAAFMLMAAIIIPSVISIRNVNNVIDSGVGSTPSTGDNPQIGDNPSTGNNPPTGDNQTGSNSSTGDNPSTDNNPSIGDNPPTGDNPSIGDNPPTGNSGGESQNTKVRTKINVFEPSLPHYLAAEVDKRIPIETDEIDITVFLGHPNFKGDRHIAFSDFVLSQEELANYKFVLMFNYNHKSLQVGMDDFDYLNPDYNVTFTEQDGIETLNFHKAHELKLSKESMLGTDYGFVNVELYLMPLDSDEKYYAAAETLYYSVTETEIVFGLVSNPHAHEGDPGIITSGWQYSSNQ